MLNEWTLQYFFDDLGHEVLYCPTPKGPEVLAVGFDEVFRPSEWNAARGAA
jgi:hypothetical protein